MKDVAGVILGASFLFPVPAVAETGAEIIEREASFYEAFIDADAEMMADIFADGFLYQHGSGQDFDEASFLGLISSGAAVVTRADAPDLRIVDFGDTVVTSGASRVEGRIGADPFGGQLRFVNVWHLEDGAWRLHHRNSQFVE
ncbi:nuclear transport factor 2 family protein [Aestuariibius sp. 2305UL40-4]|uniref:nuclear transport factor 2 family protein n=1 Tax=Aestuariibius violaceus TaxID=3234132 RepID=UPI00345EE0A5